MILETLLSQIGQAPPTTVFMLGFLLAATLRRGRLNMIFDVLFKRLSLRLEPTVKDLFVSGGYR